MAQTDDELRKRLTTLANRTFAAIREEPPSEGDPIANVLLLIPTLLREVASWTPAANLAADATALADEWQRLFDEEVSP